MIGVGLNSSGQVVKGNGATGIVGVVVLTQAFKAKTWIDVMTDGEIVEFDFKQNPRVAFASAAGTPYFAAVTTGAVTATAGSSVYVGSTVEKGRLVVRVNRGVAA